MKKFTKKDCERKLFLTEEETNIVMNAQKMFPELLTLDNEENGYVIDAFNLWNQLGCPQSEYGKWSKRKIIDKGFVENEDFLQVDRIVELQNNGHKTVVNHKLTLDCAKNICMMENTSSGQLCRKYFIVMEKVVKKMTDWLIIRNPQKQGYKEMCEAINENYKLLHEGKEPNSFIYINNADMINLALMGRKSKDMKKILEVEYDEPLRDNLVAEVNQALYELQLLNGSLLYSNIDFQTRKMIIQNTCNVKYVNIRARFSSEFYKELHKIDLESK